LPREFQNQVNESIKMIYTKPVLIWDFFSNGKRVLSCLKIEKFMDRWIDRYNCKIYELPIYFEHIFSHRLTEGTGGDKD